MYFESLLSLSDLLIIRIRAFFKTISCNTVCYDVGVRTTYPINSVEKVFQNFYNLGLYAIFRGAQTPIASTEYESKCEYKKVLSLGAWLLHPSL